MNCSAFLPDGRRTELGRQPHARPSGLRPQFHPPSKARCSEPGPDDAFRPAAGRRPASICSPHVEVSTHKAAAGRRVLSRQIRSRGNQKAEPWLWRQRGRICARCPDKTSTQQPRVDAPLTASIDWPPFVVRCPRERWETDQWSRCTCQDRWPPPASPHPNSEDLQSSVRLRHEHLEEHCRMATPRSSRLHWRVRHHHNTAERVILPDGRLGLEEIPGTAGT